MSKIGFAGIGAMGLNMSRNLLKAGFDLVVYNRTPKKCAPLVEAGAQTASSFSELLNQTDTLIMMLTGPRAIEDCVGPILEGSPSVFSGKLLVNMGTNAPAFTADLNQRLIEVGAVFVDSPVLGSSKPAELGTLLIMPSGPEDAVKKLTPLFMAMGERIVNCGQPPQASMMKLTVNLVQIAMMEGLAEGVHFARKGGLDLATLFEILLKGAVGNSLYELKARKYLEDDFTPQSTLSGVRDVLQQIAETAYDMEADIPNTLANLNLSNRAMKDGLGSEDFLRSGEDSGQVRQGCPATATALEHNENTPISPRVEGSLSDVIETIHQKGQKHLYIDGGLTIQGFLKEDLIDEMIITVIPILLGGGIPLFGELPKPMEFEHVKTEVYLNAMVQNHYRRKK